MSEFYGSQQANLEGSSRSGELTLDPQKITATQALAWFSGAWQIFVRSPGVWVFNVVLLLVMMIVLKFIPFLGSVAHQLLMPVFLAGLLLACQASEKGEQIEIAHLFAGFKQNTGNLVLVGLLYLLASTVILLFMGVAMFLTIGSSIFTLIGGETVGSAALMKAPMVLAVVGLLGLLLFIPLAMAYAFAPALVVFHNVSPIEAMKASFQGCLRNFWPFFLWGLVMLVLTIVATLPIFLGWLVLAPMMSAMTYLGYKDLYLQQQNRLV